MCICVCQVKTVHLTFVVNSGDGVSIEHTVEEGVGIFRELKRRITDNHKHIML